MKYVLAVLGILTIFAAAALLPVRPYLDFQVVYHANLGLLRGIPLYDHAGQVNMIAELAGVPAGQVYVLPFPYPPWYALSTLWLAMLPIDTAARLWLGLSLVLLFGSVWLLVGEHPARMRPVLFAGGLMWLPVLGSLFVGQYGFPVLLGAALMIHALRRENPLMIALAAALLMFKPHLGGVIVIVAAIQLVLRRDAIGRRGLAAMLGIAAILFGLGFIASAAWPIEYLHSLSGFRNVEGVWQCTQCVSPSIMLARLFGGGLSSAAWIGSAIAVLCAAWLATHWARAASNPGTLVAICVLATMLASPYLLNYDYTLLLIPFIELTRGPNSRAEWSVLALAYALPFFAFGSLGTGGNGVFILSELLLCLVALRRFTSESHKIAVAARLDE